jgi:hypothetical protein
MRFTLRDLFWAILVVALCLGWGIHLLGMHSSFQLVKQRAEWDQSVIRFLINALSEEGYDVIIDPEHKRLSIRPKGAGVHGQSGDGG